MNVWNRVLMVLVTIMCAIFGVLAANRYNLTKTQEQSVAKLEADLAKALSDVEQLRYEIYGGPEKVADNWRELGLDGQLAYVRNLQNGEAFANCAPIEARVDEDAASSKIAFGIDPQYKTTGFRTGVVAFVFDSGTSVVRKAEANSDATADEEAAAPVAADDSAEDAEIAASASVYTFLGAFKVTGATDSQVNLESIGSASAEELSALRDSARSGNSWVVYADRLPIDSPADLAYFESEHPERVAALPAATAGFVVRSLSLDDAQAIADTGDLASVESRFPVDFQGELQDSWTVRDEQNVINSRNTLALETLTNIIADQFVAMGDEVENEDVLAFPNWEDVYAAAVARKKVDSWRESIVKTEAALEKMIGYRDLVEKTLRAAEAGVADCQDAIDALIVKNAETAAKIAQAQFRALEKVEALSRTASNTASNNGDI